MTQDYRSVNQFGTLAWGIFLLALAHFLYFTWLTLDQPIIDLWGFRTPQTAIAVPYMLREGQWIPTALPVLGEPWIVPFEFPFFQWCVALLVWFTGAPIDACGRVVSAFFTVATLWPLYLVTSSLGLGRRAGLLWSALWLTAPLVIFFGRSFLIETTIVFLSAAWLAFYVRTLSRGSYVDFGACLAFGVLAALVKITGFVCFVLVGFVYTCTFVWRRREDLLSISRQLMLAGATVLLAAIALMSWGKYADAFFAQNPLANLLSPQNVSFGFFGALSDRWSASLWDWTIRLRALPQALGSAWYVVLYGLVRMGVRNPLFRVSLILLSAYLSSFLIFSQAHINHYYYQVENAIFLCGAAAITVEALLRKGRVEGYSVLAVFMAGQLSTFYAGDYFKILTDDLGKHPYYQTSQMLREVTQPDSVIIVFGTGYGADLPYFSDRRGIVLANWFPIPAVRQVVFDERERWLGGRKIGAIVDCSVYAVQDIGPALVPIRDELKREFSGRTIEVPGTFYGATPPSKCDIFLPDYPDGSSAKTWTGDHVDRSLSAKPLSLTAPYPPGTKVVYSSSACNIESINRGPFGTAEVTVAKISPLLLTGWGYDEIGRQPSRSLYVVLLDSTGTARYFSGGARVTSRPDVGQYLRLPNLVDVGFEASLSLASVEAGKYHVLIGLAGVSDFRLCDVGRWISVQ